MIRARRVLVVDDDQGMVDTLCDIFELHGWESVRAYDGTEAVVLSAQRDVDAVVMDIKMPRLNGVDALRAIKARKPTLPIVLITAMAADEQLAQAGKQGALAILKKPLDPEGLLDLLDTAVPKPA